MSARVHVAACGVVLVVCATLPLQSKASEFHIGVGVHHGDVPITVADTSLSSGISFKESSTSWKAVMGVRPLPLFGAELEYVRFGSVGSGPQVIGGQNVGEVRGRLSAVSAFGLLYLPISSSPVDLYAKAGYARITGKARTYPAGVVCPAVVPAPWYCLSSFDHDLDDNVVAAGAGFKLGRGSWALRAEYEVFMLKGANAGTVSLGIVKSLL